MQGGGGEKLLVGRHRGHDRNGFQGMDDVGESLAAPFRSGVGPDGKMDRTVEKVGIENGIGHDLLIHEGEIFGLLQKERSHGLVAF